MHAIHVVVHGHLVLDVDACTQESVHDAALGRQQGRDCLILLQLGHDQPHDIVFTCMQETGSTFDHFINLTQGRGEGHVEDQQHVPASNKGQHK